MRTNFSRKEHQDSALALMLIIMLVYFIGYREEALLVALTVSLLFTMILPVIFYPFTILWLNLSHYLGIVSSFFLLSIIFLVIVTPVGLFRKLAGKDPLSLRKFRKGADTVFISRKHLFTRENLSNPF
ncbi:MAG: SxtJ family membrane protein [Bacteroidales bacterium]